MGTQIAHDGAWTPLKLRVTPTREIIVGSPEEAVAHMENWPLNKGFMFDLAFRKCLEAVADPKMTRAAWLAFRAAITEVDWVEARCGEVKVARAEKRRPAKMPTPYFRYLDAEASDDAR